MARDPIAQHAKTMAGEYLVAGHLSLLGYTVFPTLKNFPDADLVLINPTTRRYHRVQVKTSTENLYHLGEKIDLTTTPYVFVHLLPNRAYEFFIIPAEDAARISRAERDDYLRRRPHVNPNQPRMISLLALQPYKDQWENILK